MLINVYYLGRVKTGFCASCAMREIADDAFKKGRAFVPTAINKNLNGMYTVRSNYPREYTHSSLSYCEAFTKRETRRLA